MGLLGGSLLVLATFSASAMGDVTKHPNWSLLNPDNCGVSSTDRIIGGREPPMGYYPWLVVFGYTFQFMRTPPMFRCGGVLINKRYVLTAAHCITDLPFTLRLDVVRLGEHNLTSNPDCELTDCYNGACDKYCADPVQEYKPQRLIYHESYNIPKFKHDVGLVRLERDVNITEWVIPICLPYGKMLYRYFFGRMAEVAGWGLTDAGAIEGSQVPMHVWMKVVNNQNCVNSYRSLYISYSQMCVGGEDERDSCAGDSGGPLMLADDEFGMPRYYAIGVVSFGATECGTKGVPGVYTRISSYMIWVLDHLQP